jgi:cytoskeleton protein RodZ
MNKEVLTVESTSQVDELCEDIEVVGPGLILSEARKKLSLSIEDVSNKLNFRTNLVNEIEQDVFDASLPATYNRGYLRSYAKLVDVEVDEVLSAYDMLSIAEIQRSEMQSFSNLTEKQAENSRLMWFSYLIVALLFGMMVLWWLQEQTLSVNLFDSPKQAEEQVVNGELSDKTYLSVESSHVELSELAKVETVEKAYVIQPSDSENKALETNVIIENVSTNTNINSKVVANTELKPETESIPESMLDISTVVFTFSGDCWVNIYDATGDRVAWGVKKSGYVMTVTGKPPLKVTLGKPELTTIVFDGEQVDMSSFNTGNIVKFTLPLLPE